MRKLIYLFIFMLFISCDQVWSESDKDNFIHQCIMSAYGVSLSNSNQEFIQDQATEYCNCVVELLIENYPNSKQAEQAIINMSEEGRIEFLYFCVENYLKK